MPLIFKKYSFGTFCGNRSFVPYYEIYLGSGADSQIVGRTSANKFNLTTFPYGNFTWMISAFNGLNDTNSSSWHFELCQAGIVETPTLSPPLSSLQIANITLSWEVEWNDNCYEAHSTSVTVRNYTEVLLMLTGLNDTTTSLHFSEEELITLGFSDCTYQWDVKVTKGSQVVTSTSSFEYCVPVSETVTLLGPGKRNG